MRQPPDSAVRDTLATVFETQPFDRSLRDTAWSRITAWFGELFDRLTGAVAGSPVAYWGARVLLLLLVSAVLGRIGYLLWVEWRTRTAWRRSVLGAPGSDAAADLWTRAQGEAGAGRYTEAAHLLYLSLLATLARRDRLTLHPSKTVGDYARELRARSSSAFAAFRDFARGYETVVYDLQYCDRERYERLRELAQPLLQPHG